MTTLKESILKSVKAGKHAKYTLFPKNTDELIEIVAEEIYRNGNECSLNHIDTSKITDMNSLFYFSDFNGDISEWDVSKVTNMSNLFDLSEFNGDISRWDVSSVTNMSGMFAHSLFNNDSICKWNISSVNDMEKMFFGNKAFNHNISKWKINSKCNTNSMFRNCDIKDKYKPFKDGKRIE